MYDKVLKTGGRFMCLEFSKVKPQELETLYDLYSFQVELVSLMGLVSKY